MAKSELSAVYPKWMPLQQSLRIMEERFQAIDPAAIEAALIAALHGGDITARLITPPNDEMRLELEIDRLDWGPVTTLSPPIEDVQAAAARALMHTAEQMKGRKQSMPRRHHFSSLITDNHIVYGLYESRVVICRDEFVVWLELFARAQTGMPGIAAPNRMLVEQRVMSRPAQATLSWWYDGYLQDHPDPSEAMVLTAAKAWSAEHGYPTPTRQQIRDLMASTTTGPRKRGPKPKRAQ